MVNAIKEKYHEFGDAKIERIEYRLEGEQSKYYMLSIYLVCFNWPSEKWENVRLDFWDVFVFRYVDTIKLRNSVVFEAMLVEDETGIICDFYPIQVDGLGKLGEDPKSSFVVHSRTIAYEVLSPID
ncbi:hypothetical protein [Deminuibacter soli]|nr:hypothetical protein [Deminuibacter soli]